MSIGKRILIVTNQVPGHEAGFQQSGHAQYLGGFLTHFRLRELEVILLVLRPRLDSLFLRAESFDYEIVGPSFRRIGRWIVSRSASMAAGALAWSCYLRLPARVQAAVDKLRLTSRTARGFVHALGRFPSRREIAYVKAMIQSRKPDIIVYDGIFNSCGRVRCDQQWVITHEVKHQRAASFAANGIRILPASFGSQAERAILEESGNAVAIQWDDAREFEQLSPGTRVVVVPVTVSIRSQPRDDQPRGSHCIFVGSGSFHNLHGIRWFLDECWPLVRAVVPTATLHVIGSVCFRLSHAPLGVTYGGVIDDLEKAYETAAVTLVPLRIGSGLKVKLVEALAYGQAIVTTSVGAQGLLHFEPQPFLLADSAADFAAKTAELLMSPERQKQLGALAATCARAFRPEVAFSELDAAMFGT